MAKLEEILKAEGYTEEELQNSPLLQDQRFRSSLENQFGAVASDRDKWKAERDNYEQWREQTANPHIAAIEKEAADARLEAARVREQLKLAKDWGYISDEQQRNEAAAAAQRGSQPQSGLDASQFYTKDDINKLADGYGEGIVQASDLAQEYEYLYGKPLFQYSIESDGRTLRGMTALRHEAKQNRKNVLDYTREKFNFNGRHKEIAEQRAREHDEKIRQEAIRETESKYAQQRSNPFLTTPQNSRSSFIPGTPGASRTSQDGKPVQPWDEMETVKKARRIENAVKTQMGQVN